MSCEKHQWPRVSQRRHTSQEVDKEAKFVVLTHRPFGRPTPVKCSKTKMRTAELKQLGPCRLSGWPITTPPNALAWLHEAQALPGSSGRAGLARNPPCPSHQRWLGALGCGPN
jgi:hypothetical protein